jgi:hypothetical protein
VNSMRKKIKIRRLDNIETTIAKCPDCCRPHIAGSASPAPRCASHCSGD